MHLTAPSLWSRSIGTGGRDASERVVTIVGMRSVAGMLEFALGGMLMLGLLTRPVAFILSGEMAFAYFIEHFPHSFYPIINDGGLAIMLCFGCLLLAAAGGGPISLDAMLGLTKRQSEP